MPNRPTPTGKLVSAKSAPHLARITAAMLRHARILPREFFNRDPVTVGRELLGKLLIRREGRRLLAGRIVEDEAYLGVEDPAAHAYSGRTPRNAVLFGPPGHAYVYFIYGNHYCLNVSCMPEGRLAVCCYVPWSRCLEWTRWPGLAASSWRASPRPAQLRMISSGPGRMSQALGITRLRDNDKDLTAPHRTFGLPTTAIAPSALQPRRVSESPKRSSSHYGL